MKKLLLILFLLPVFAKGQAQNSWAGKFWIYNNIQNLKSALRKLGERTQGNKEQLLIRLAHKLATPEGKMLVRANFKPEIFRQLYEVEIQGNI